MFEFFDKHKVSINITIRIITIFIVCMSIILTLPKVGVFQYEYEEGLPWRYESLTAPFDFPIYKTDKQLETAKKQALEEYIPIFNYDSEKTVLYKKSIRNLLTEIIPDTLDAYPAIAMCVDSIYSAGIIQITESMQDFSPEYIKVVTNNHGRNVEFKNVYTPKKAYIRLIDELKKNIRSKSILQQVMNSEISNLFVPNLKFDTQKTQSDIEKVKNTISITNGFIKEGEVIITKRETVTPEKMQLLNSLKQSYKDNEWSSYNRKKITIGQSLLVIISVFIYSIFFFYSKKELLHNTKGFLFLYIALLLMVLTGAIAYHKNINFYSIPVLFFVIIVNILIGGRSALYMLISGTIMLSCFAPNSTEFIFMQLTAGIVGIFTLSSMQRRGQLFLSTLFIFLTYLVSYIAFALMKNGELEIAKLHPIFWLMLNCLLITLTYPAIYIFERIFGFTSETTLIELSNPHHPVLRELTQKAPGTFQHSLIVANMAEEAIDKIGGNALLARTGALYHDIGKTDSPFLFIENQTGGVNPHEYLECDESAQKIIAHVEHGVEIAKKHHLPKVIIDFIRTHHGRSKVKYFYNSYKNKYPDKGIDESLFTYKGPDPVSIECTVVMIADSVEAIVRSLDEKSEESISRTINSVIDNMIMEGRMKDSEISFKDIGIVKRSFLEILTSIYHSRIS